VLLRQSASQKTLHHAILQSSPTGPNHAHDTDRTSEAAIFSRVIEPEKAMLSPEAARSILALDFCPEDRQRMQELAAKARAGSLTTDEQEELDNCGRVGSLLGIMKSKARRSLENRGHSNGSSRNIGHFPPSS
jgi:hypothetical protein